MAICSSSSSGASISRIAEPALAVGERAAEQRDDLLHRERAQRVDLGAREQRGDDLERRVLGGGADQDDVAALDVRQERVLLGLVEAVDLVDEQQRAAAHGARLRSASAITSLISLMPLSTALKGTKSALREAGDQAGERGLADARAAPRG